jgi:hypothetical protein
MKQTNEAEATWDNPVYRGKAIRQQQGNEIRKQQDHERLMALPERVVKDLHGNHITVTRCRISSSKAKP